MPEVVTTGARTFFGVPAAADLAAVAAQVVFLGVPYDGGTPQPGNRTGQKLGPAAARQASWEQFAYRERAGHAFAPALAHDAARRLIASLGLRPSNAISGTTKKLATAHAKLATPPKIAAMIPPPTSRRSASTRLIRPPTPS